MDSLVSLGSLIAGAVGAWFAYVAVRGNVWRRRRPHSGVERLSSDKPYDAVISYAEDDESKAEWIAQGLRTRGRRVFIAKWVDIGLVEYLERDRAISNTANGILIFSKVTMGHPEVRSDYAALLGRANSNGRRFIPVLTERVDLPTFASIRKALDFTDSRFDSENLDRLANAIGPDATPS